LEGPFEQGRRGLFSTVMAGRPGGWTTESYSLDRSSGGGRPSGAGIAVGIGAVSEIGTAMGQAHLVRARGAVISQDARSPRSSPRASDSVVSPAATRPVRAAPVACVVLAAHGRAAQCPRAAASVGAAITCRPFTVQFIGSSAGERCAARTSARLHESLTSKPVATLVASGRWVIGSALLWRVPSLLVRMRIGGARGHVVWSGSWAGP
jgi:hypothetical protein